LVTTNNTRIDAIELLVKRIKWFFYLVKTFTRLKPKCSFLIVTLSLITQILRLMSFLVPIKMLFLLGESRSYPHTIFHFEIHSSEELALLFFAIILFVILSYFALERLGASNEKRCSQDIWQNNQKLMVYSNQGEIASVVYKRYLQSLGALFFLTFVLVLLMYIYPLVSGVTLSFWLLALSVLTLSYSRFKYIRLKIRDDMPQVINLLAMINFLIVFLIVMFDYVSFEGSRDLIHAVIGLILIRHILGNILSLVQGVAYLYSNKERINTIFFSGRHTSTKASKKENELVNLFEPHHFKIWMQETLSEITKCEIDVEGYSWYELGISNEITIIVQSVNLDEAVKEIYFVKIYNKQMHSKAIQEKVLFDYLDLSAISYVYLGTASVDTFTCNVFKYDEMMQIPSAEFAIKQLEFKLQFLEYPLPSAIIKQYVGTHKLVYDRITEELLETLLIAADESEKVVVNTFMGQMKPLVTLLAELPLQLVVPVMSGNALVYGSHENLISLSFSNWRIEPLGFGFSLHPNEQQALIEAVGMMNGQAAETERIVSEKLVQIISFYAELEKNLNRQSFKAAIENIQRVLTVFDEIE